ncbi:MAG TPA: M20/M25/M40 family metallo-hydrolase [Chthonomonadaceae bacterium]|nr:M20/M25/M40 family metallo-hydrolase [Chthonomonadaceae bacterium]
MMLRSSTRACALLLPFLALSGPLLAQQTPPPDDVIARIRDEGMNHSQLMPTLSYLCDVIGPRLTGSPSMKHANEWTRDKMTSWGLQNAHLESWGPFGRGWSLERFSMQVVSPTTIPLIAYPKAWSPGLKGTYTGEVVYVDATDEAGLAKYKGHLKGAIVLNSPIREVRAHFEPMGRRYTDEQLLAMESAAPRQPGAGRGGPGGGPGGAPGGPGGGNRAGRNGAQDFRAAQQFAPRKLQFYREEGAALVVEVSNNGDDGTLFVQSATVPPPPGAPTARPAAAPGGAPGAAAGTPPAGAPATPGGAPGAAAGTQPAAPGGGFARRVSPWDKNAPAILPQVVVSKEHYNRLVRMVQQGANVKISCDLAVKFYDQDLMAYNTVAEIPGSDLKDQVVMLGAHMDSWHSGTGATDNGAGCAVCMEAVRILKALNLQPRRTIRIALWSGEEEGLFGSRAYVSQHFAARETPSGAAPTGAGGGGFGAPAGPLVHKSEYDKISAYYNLDNGTGKIRGIYLQGNEALRSLFHEWLAPFKDLGATTVTINNTGSTDHVSFDGVGIPGFQFIQDSIDYETLTHHSNQDLVDHIQADDLKQAAVIMAAFVYNTAMRDEMLPRKPVQEAAGPRTQ